jgi:hypothetical protein
MVTIVSNMSMWKRKIFLLLASILTIFKNVLKILVGFLLVLLESNGLFSQRHQLTMNYRWFFLNIGRIRSTLWRSTLHRKISHSTPECVCVNQICFVAEIESPACRMSWSIDILYPWQWPTCEFFKIYLKYIGSSFWRHSFIIILRETNNM